MVVTITCYGKTQIIHDVPKAIRFYTRGIAETEGAEQMRYISIVAQLKDGLTEVVDTNPDYNPNY